jgi:di/tricarboxylate transporter
LENNIIILSLIVFLVLLVVNKIRPALLFSGLIVFYYMFGFIKTDTLLHNFTNTGLVILVLLLTVSIIIEKTHMVSRLVQLLDGSSYRFYLLKLAVVVVASSAFLNNTAVVASLMSALKSNKNFSPSRVLIPLSYFSILGGTLTLIGTSTNLIVNSFVVQAGLNPLEMFDFFLVGIGLVTSVVATIIVVAPWLLPDRKQDVSEKPVYFLNTKVREHSSLVGKNVVENELRNLEKLFLVEILRDDTLISPVSPETIIEENDVLIFVGDIADIQSLKHFDGLEIFEEDVDKERDNLVEVVVSHNANILNTSIKDADFRSRFDAAVVAVRRGDKKLHGKIGSHILKVGDTLVLAIGQDFTKHNNIQNNFYMVSNIDMNRRLSISQGRIAIGAFGIAIFLATLGAITLLKALMLLLMFYYLTGMLSFTEIKRFFPFTLVIIIGSALGIADVLYESGLASDMGETMLQMFGQESVYGAFIVIFLLTTIITEIMTNNAAAALTFPIALAISQSLGVSPWPFIMAVAYGASASFLSPYGYQTNLMVSSVGKYSIKDFFKIGLPVFIVNTLVALVLIPLVFPF